MTREQMDYIESEDFIAGFDCLKHEVPWIVAEAIFELEGILSKDDVVLEIGSGGSTLFYANKCKKVIAIETSIGWALTVTAKLENSTAEIEYHHIKEETDICEKLFNMDIGEVTVFSVDPQGGYNRSKILEAFLDKGISPKLRIIVLDNYAHEGIFPNHYNRVMAMGYGWKCFEFNHSRWAGSGTMIYLKIK